MWRGLLLFALAFAVAAVITIGLSLVAMVLGWVWTALGW